MDYFLIKLLNIIIGISEVLAQEKTRQRFETGDGETFTLPNPLGTTSTFAEIIDRVTGYLIVIAAPIATLMILLAAFKILTAGDNPENLKSAKQMILWTVVGYAIILVSKGITLIIKQLLGAK
ncbi:MAG: pilin [Patescibacteria group bacterium]